MLYVHVYTGIKCKTRTNIKNTAVTRWSRPKTTFETNTKLLYYIHRIYGELLLFSRILGPPRKSSIAHNFIAKKSSGTSRYEAYSNRDFSPNQKPKTPYNFARNNGYMCRFELHIVRMKRPVSQSLITTVLRLIAFGKLMRCWTIIVVKNRSRNVRRFLIVINYFLTPLLTL